MSLRALPWWASVLLVWGASRIVSTSLVLLFAAQQHENAWTGASPSLVDFSTMWDAHWYRIIALQGYPSTLPLTADGFIDENAWAFMPVYAFVTGGFAAITGLPWAMAAVLVSLAASAGFALVAYRLFVRVLPTGALFAVALVCCSPTSPMFQFGYAESLGMLLLAAALLAWRERAWQWLFVLVPVMALTRPMGLAFSFALALWAFWTLWDDRGAPWRSVRAPLLMAVWSGVWGLAWPLAAWLSTGELQAYTETELAWRSDYIGRVDLVPFTPWIQGFAWWFGDGWGPVWLLGLIVAGVMLMRTGPARALGPEARLWCIAYAVYLLAVFFPQSSTFRLLMPLFPVAGALAQVRNTPMRVLMVAAGVAGQIVWLWACWQVDGVDWTPP